VSLPFEFAPSIRHSPEWCGLLGHRSQLSLIPILAQVVNVNGFSALVKGTIWLLSGAFWCLLAQLPPTHGVNGTGKSTQQRFGRASFRPGTLS
jgi:hypothetical protein